MDGEVKLGLKVIPAGISAVSLLEPIITFLEEYQGAVSYFLGEKIENNLRNTALLGIEAAGPAFEAPPERNPELGKALTALAEYLQNNGLLTEASVEKVTSEIFRFRIGGCAFAKHVHGVSKPIQGPGAVCPLVLMAVKFLMEGDTSGLELGDSQYSADGTETEIRLVRKQKR